MPKSGTMSSPELTTGIRIEVDSQMDDQLEMWAVRDGRSKREQVRYLVKELVSTYAKDPLILHRIALFRAGAATFTHA